MSIQHGDTGIRRRGNQRPALLGQRRPATDEATEPQETLMGIRLLRRPVGRAQMRARVARERANEWLLRVGRGRRGG